MDQSSDSDDYELMPKKEIDRLRKEISVIRKNPYGVSDKGQDLQQSIERLNSTLNKFIAVLEDAQQDIIDEYQDSKPVEKLNQILDQNETIARALVTINDTIKKSQSNNQSQSNMPSQSNMRANTANSAPQQSSQPDTVYPDFSMPKDAPTPLIQQPNIAQQSGVLQNNPQNTPQNNPVQSNSMSINSMQGNSMQNNPMQGNLGMRQQFTPQPVRAPFNPQNNLNTGLNNNPNNPSMSQGGFSQQPFSMQQSPPSYPPQQYSNQPYPTQQYPNQPFGNIPPLDGLSLDNIPPLDAPLDPGMLPEKKKKFLGLIG